MSNKIISQFHLLYSWQEINQYFQNNLNIHILPRLEPLR